MPSVSVIIPCFNQGEYLRDSFGSVLAQTWTDWEVIIVDDGSTDTTTRRILDDFQHPSARVIRSVNLGLAAARNLGITHATGRYILPLDCDDKIAPTYLAKAVALLEAEPDLGIIYCEAEFFGVQSGPWLLPPYRYPEILFTPAIFCAGMFRRTDWVEAGGYNPELLHGYEDHDFWLALIKRGRGVRQIPEILFYYRRTSRSMAQSLSVEQQVASFMVMFRRHRELFLENLPTLFRGYFSREALAQVHHQRPVLQLFTGASGDYNELDSVRTEYSAGDWVTLTVRLPDTDHTSPLPLRLDPGMQDGCYELAEVSLLDDTCVVAAWGPDQEGAMPVAVEGSAVALPGQSGLHLFSFGSDPQVILSGLRCTSPVTAARIRLRYQPGIAPAATGFSALKATGRL